MRFLSAVAFGLLVILAHNPFPTAVNDADLPQNIPHWNKSDAKTGCSPVHKNGTPNLLIVNQANERKIVSFHYAWTVTHNKNRADDLWVIGYC